MPKNRWLLCAAGLGLLCGAGASLPAASPPGPPPAGALNHPRAGPEDGLSAVTSIIQTHDGYLWLGTLYGLVRFDGVRFTVFDENNTPGLKSSQIVHLFEDSQSNLWVGTESAGVGLIRDGQVKSLDIGQGSRAGRLMSACEDSRGAVWLYTADGQLCRYRHGTVQVRPFGAQYSSNCRALAVEKSGLLWVGVDWGLFGIGPTAGNDPNDFPLQQFFQVNKLDFLLASPGGGYWRLADGRVQKWTANRLERDLGPYPWSQNVPVTAACEDREGNLVVGTYGAGVFWSDAAGHFTQLASEQGLSHMYILALCVDREGDLWVGTNGGGLNRVKKAVFHVLEPTRGLTVQSVCEDGQGGLWIGYNGDRVDHWTGGGPQRFAVAPGSNVKAVFADRQQRLWVGLWSALGPGLFQWQADQFQPAVGFDAFDRQVSAVYQDRRGLLWVGTQGGLARRDEHGWNLFTKRDGLASDVVRAIAEDREGNLWIGTGGGLSRLRDGTFTSYHKADGLPSDNISSLWVDAEGALWVGTSGGLARFHHDQWRSYTTRDGLISNSIGYLAEDGQGALWIGSNAGLMRVPLPALNNPARGPTNPLPCRAYGKADGLPTRECSSGSQPAVCRAPDGTLWFPTINGLVSVNPAHLSPNTNPPPVVIESVRVEGQEQNTNSLRGPMRQIVTVPAGKERLEIQFTCLNLSAPERARFQYRLENHEAAWNELPAPPVGSAPVARYSNLPPGRYRFQVIACNEDGVWNQAGSTLAVVVLPPFWRTGWFLGVTTAGLLGLVVAGVHYLSTQKLARQLEGMRQQEALEKERARIARDIHDQLGASLTQISLLGELVEGDKHAPDEVEAHARQISQTARDTTRVLDEIVWTVNPSNDTLDGLITYVCKYAQEYLAVAGLRYRLEAPPQLPGTPISPEVRHNVFLAAKEAVTNVVRHAHATEVHLRLRLQPGVFTLEIQDNGRGPAGLAEKAAQSRNGLRNMRKRMEDVGGSFSFGPAPDGGTVVRLTAPGGES